MNIRSKVSPYWVRLRKWIGIRGSKSLYLYSMLIGMLAGVGSYGFAYSLAVAEHFSFEVLAGYHVPHPAGELRYSSGHASELNRFILFILPIIGGLITGSVIHFFCKEASGTGTDEMVKSFHYNEGKMSLRAPIFKTIATIFTLASGGSAGKEGPTSQIGAGVGAVIGKIIGVGARARRSLLLAGTAGGLGAIFRAPFGGAMTAVEIIYKEDIESDSMIPCIISSVTAYLVFTGIAGSGSVFHVGGDISLKHYNELFLYFILGLLCFSVGFVFVKAFNFVENIFKKIPVHPIIKPAMGGFVVGSIGYFFPEIIGSGFGLLQESINGKSLSEHSGLLYVSYLYLLIAFLKIITTSFTIGSGGSGGVFGPSLFIGGMLGGFIGTLAKYYFPEYEFTVPPFILVGMGSFFAGIARAPIAGMIMVCDMIGSYKLLPQLMIVSVLSFVLSHRWSIYKSQVENRFKSPAHEWDMNQDIMDRLTIGEHFSEFPQRAIVPGNMLFTDLVDSAPDLQESDYIVINSDGSYYGTVSVRKSNLKNDIREFVKFLITVEDISIHIPCITTTESLGKALKILLDNDLDKVAVLKENKVIGYLGYVELLSAYHKEIITHSTVKRN
ncbi:MAG: chloride channel protein [Leptospiraceae bacterium]|nr:chloride channel protein [Leptospiraceae bacterium]MCP5496864.1 chloride channel protein [Leptospiraceae bacterium]